MALYIKSNLFYKILNKFCLIFHYLESLFIRLKIGVELSTIEPFDLWFDLPLFLQAAIVIVVMLLLMLLLNYFIWNIYAN